LEEEGLGETLAAVVARMEEEAAALAGWWPYHQLQKKNSVYQ
jgi:hypothetical protein